MLKATERKALSNVVAVVSRKGGVGKTVTATHLAGAVARSGRRALLIDLDPQGSAGMDLAYIYADGSETNAEGQAIFDDEGAGIARAVATGTPLTPMRIRPGLDVLPGGEHIEALIKWLYITEYTTSAEEAYSAFAHRLAEIAGEYDLIVLDIPPVVAAIRSMALYAARWVLIPTNSDDGALAGVEAMLDTVQQHQGDNPELGVLGVVLFAVARTQVDKTRAAHEASLERAGIEAPVFSAYIRAAPISGAAARSRGQLVGDLAEDVANQPKWWERRQMSGRGEKVDSLPANASTLAGDWTSALGEILSRYTDASAPVTRKTRRQTGGKK